MTGGHRERIKVFVIEGHGEETSRIRPFVDRYLSEDFDIAIL
jgi:hypothetical protein